MKQIKLPKHSFMIGAYIDLKLCDDIIEYHKTFRHRAYNGTIGDLTNSFVDTKIKQSLDLHINKNPFLFEKYNKELEKVLDLYQKKYICVKDLRAFNNIQENTNIQYYTPDGGFKNWHCERNGSSTSRRQFVFMTYLNDVPKGGTDFYYYPELNIQAKKGLTLIWPSDWTHTHKGVISKTHEKYIVTGWFSFY
jgi:prolyl 4-hydroxylase